MGRKRTGLILDTLEILAGHPTGEARRQLDRWVCAQRRDLSWGSDLGIICIQMGSNTMGVSELTREFLGVRRAPGRKSGENQELRVMEDY